MIMSVSESSFRKMQYSFIATLVESRSYFSLIQTMIIKNEDSDFVVEFLTLPFRYPDFSNDLTFSLSGLIQDILTIPLLLNRIGPDNIVKVTNSFPFQLLTDSLPDLLIKHELLVTLSTTTASTESLSDYSYPALITFLSNYAVFAQYGISNLSETSVFFLCDAINIIITEFSRVCTLYDDKIVDEDDSEDEEVSLGSKRLIKLDPKMMYWLKSIYSGPIIQKACEKLFQSKAHESAIIIAFFINLYQKIPGAETNILNHLLYQNNDKYRIIKFLFLLLQETKLYQTFCTEQSDLQLISSAMFHDYWPVLFLLAELLIRLLYTYGNEEFYSDSNILGLDNLCSLAVVVRNLALSFYLSEISDSITMQYTDIPINALIPKCTKLLQQLFQRE
jgi:hypothetical protein